MTPPRIALCLVFAVLAGAQARAETITSVEGYMAAKRAALAADCTTLSFGGGFASTVNVDGDVRDDLLIDWHAAQCNESSAYFCGSGGCDMEVWLSGGEGRFERLETFFGYAIDFDRPHANPPSFVVGLHGSACGKGGMEPCSMRYRIEDGNAVQVGEVEAPKANE